MIIEDKDKGIYYTPSNVRYFIYLYLWIIQNLKHFINKNDEEMINLKNEILKSKKGFFIFVKKKNKQIFFFFLKTKKQKAKLMNFSLY